MKKEHHTLPSIKSVRNLKGKRVIVRASLNVPLEHGRVTDEYRVKRAAETIKYLKGKDARVVILAHIGRDPKESLRPVVQALHKYTTVGFLPEINGPRVADTVAHMKNGTALLLENIRRDEREKKGDAGFAKELAALGDIYVNDAFADSHRAHTSVTGIPKHLPSYAGLLFLDEIAALHKLKTPKHPFAFILGGAKFETKLPVLKEYAKKAGRIFIGGALANNFFKELGYETGTSLVEDEQFGLPRLLKRHAKITIPADVVVKGPRGTRITAPDQVKKKEMVVDVGPEARAQVAALCDGARTILLNGPLGFYEKGFAEGTRSALQAMAKTGAFTVVGGGDSVLLVNQMKAGKKISFVSTGGGAMLVYLAKGTLPGIDALVKQKKKK